MRLQRTRVCLACALATLIAFVAIPGCGALMSADVLGAYSSRPLQARLIDVATGQPVEGAIAVATWTLEGDEGYPLELLAVRETVSDRDGHFSLEGWGPLARTKGHVTSSQPRLFILHPKFWPFETYNQPRNGKFGSFANGALQFHLQGQAIALRPLADPGDKNYLIQLNGFANDLYSAMLGGDVCYWKLIPRSVIALDRIKAGADPESRNHVLPNVTRLRDFRGVSGCDDMPMQLKEYP